MAYTRVRQLEHVYLMEDKIVFNKYACFTSTKKEKNTTINPLSVAWSNFGGVVSDIADIFSLLK